MLGVRHITDSRKLSWSFHEISPKNINPFPPHYLPGIPTLLSYSFFDFSHRCLFFVFSFPRNFEKGFAVTLQTVAYALYRFFATEQFITFLLEHMSLFSTHNWAWNMQCHLETCQTRFTFSLWPPPLLSSWLLFTSTHRPFFYQKTIAKTLSHKFKKC